MTADEKTELARFLDLSLDTLSSGFGNRVTGYTFSDDADPDEPAAPALPGEDSLETLAAEIQSCDACRLCKTRTQAVPGEGATAPLVMVIGSGPGIEEEQSGRPFAGQIGERLDSMLSAIGLSRNTNCYLSTAVKCRMPDSREPKPEETIACAAFLQRQIQLLNPRMILCVGRTAAQSLLRTSGEIDSLRGKINKIRIGISVYPVAVTYHPDDLWKNTELKRPAWEDLKMAKAWLDANTAAGCAGTEDA